MHKIMDSLGEQQRPRTSMSFKSSNRESNLAEFIPFSNERDRMGRLIKSSGSFSQNPGMIEPFIETQRKNGPPNTVQSKMEDRMSKYFKRNGLPGVSPELNKNRIVKKSLISIAFDDRNAKKTKKQPFNQNIKDKDQCKNDQLQQAKKSWKKKQSQSSLGLRRLQSSYIPRSKSQISPKKLDRKTETKLFIPKNSASFSATKRQKLDLQKFQQLNMYHKRQQLQLKMQTTFEVGHMKFIDKMMKSKQLAFQVKSQLDRMDHYY